MKIISREIMKDKVYPKVLYLMVSQMNCSIGEQLFLNTWREIKLAIDKQMQDFLLILIRNQCKL